MRVESVLPLAVFAVLTPLAPGGLTHLRRGEIGAAIPRVAFHSTAPGVVVASPKAQGGAE